MRDTLNISLIIPNGMDCSLYRQTHSDSLSKLEVSQEAKEQ